MASVIGNAFSGLAKTVAGINKGSKSTHQQFIENKLLPHTIKLQKETAWRRYKDAQNPLQDATLALKDFGKEEWPSTKTGTSTTGSTTKATAAALVSPSNSVGNGDSVATQTTTKSMKSDESSTIITPDDETTTTTTLDGEMTIATINTDVEEQNHDASRDLPPTSLSTESSEIQQQTSTTHEDAATDAKGHTENEESIANLTVNVHDDNGSTNGTSNTIVTDEKSEKVDNENQVIDKETVKRTVALLEVTSGDDLAVVASTKSLSTDISSTVVPLSSSSSSTVNDDDLIVHSAIIKTIEAFLVVLTHKTKAARPTELALEGIAMIVDHQYFHGRAGGIDDNTGSGRFTVAQSEKDQTPVPPPSLLHRVLFGISEISESYAENVQAAVINTLTKIVTAPTCYVHEGSLLLAMRATFHVYLVTKSTTCKDSARTALLNMLRAVFIRMEAHEAVVVGNIDAGFGGRRRSRQQSPKVESTAVPSENGNGQNNSNATTNGNRSRTRTDSTDGSTSVGTGLQNSSPKSGYFAFPSQYHADAYFLFRSLCKISSKELQADTLDESERKGSILYALSATGTDPTEMNGKILSLELLLAAMDVCGSAFTSGGRFLFLVQQYLSGSLLKNCVSNHTQVAFLSQRIFLVLVYKFKDNLKQDIEVFITNVFFRVLESQNSTFKQKALVLESLRTICKDPTILTQIFLNYDCDFNAMNLYKDILQTLTKLGGKATSAPKSTLSQKEAEREFDLCLAALECLVNILKTFLRALNLPCGDESDDTDDIAGMRIRSLLNLDQALALLPGSSNASNGGDSIQSDSTHSVRMVPPAISSPQQQSIDASSQSDVTGQIVDAFDRKRNAEQNIEIGSVKFTLSLKSGLSFFIEQGIITLDAKEIALFFIANKDRLDKTQMGEALGREPHAAFVKNPENVEPDKGGVGFWFRILHHFTEALDFTNLRFDEAIRLFLSGFRLPGEAQKIDRIMEKFAERFTALNPGVFPSSDTAFILAFSVIMLNTDLHNPSIKPERRMTVESFIRNNRGIGENGSDLPDEFLKGIFDRIKESPFSLKEDDAVRERVGNAASKQIFDASIFFDGSAGLFGASAEERRRENFMKERDEMMAVTERLMKHRAAKKKLSTAPSNSPSIANSVPPSEVVKPMFDVTWGPVLGILSQVLECSDDERSVAVCLNGFVFAVRLAANSSMSLARDTFTSSLAKFTFLGSLKEMKRKNVESIRSLLSIAVSDGENLGESWGPVLQCISQLARLRLAGNGLDSDDSFLMSDESKRLGRRDASKVSIFGQPYKDEATREAEENNAKAVLEAVQEVLIDKVFSSTTSLSAKGLAHFIRQMMIVSTAEIDGTSKSGITGVDTIKRGSIHADGSSIYMLQRLVDVADHNMNIRPRLVWTQVWELMAEFFVANACHSNPKVSVFAIDSLKQLSLKFLDKPELSEFNFQSSFLRPFQVVMENKASRVEIREMVLSCVDNIIRTKSQNLRSGWKILFAILAASAFDEHDQIEKKGLTILQTLLDEHLNEVGSLVDKHAAEVEVEEMSSIDKRNRNANAEEFICLCKASLSYLKADNGGRYRPLGLTLRAFCHIAIYSDLIASGRVLPPLTTGQSTDPQGQWYTYGDLTDQEATDMILWRPIFEGLAEGIDSNVSTSECGVGCFIQRASILALRAIFLRHGALFSTSQMAAILKTSVIPILQSAAENDSSPVVSITSESPLISNIDFLIEAMPLPPDEDDVALRQFETQNNSLSRNWGPAELMLEASFTDLRYGGDGDLRKAHALAKRALADSSSSPEQPFPDSWIATTASMALGLLTEIVTEFVIARGQEGRDKIWPPILDQYKLWYLGHGSTRNPWSPCEALVRITSTELHRLSERLVVLHDSSTFPDNEQESWSSIIIHMVSDFLAQSLEDEEKLRLELLHYGMNSMDGKSKEIIAEKKEDDTITAVDLNTQAEANQVVDATASDSAVDESGGKGKKKQSVKVLRRGRSDASDDNDSKSMKLVPLLKIRCVAAHCLQHFLADGSDPYIRVASKDVMSTLLHNLQTSRLTSSSAVGDEHISAAFQSLLLKEWGDGNSGPDESTESSARFTLLHGSSVYFLSQEASATKAAVKVLSVLFNATPDSSAIVDWNKSSFAESHLIKMLEEILEKFIESETKEGHLVDINMWRNTNEIGAKVALYCAAFAPIVVDTLKILLSLSSNRFETYKLMFYPLLCSLIQVRSEDIRLLVQQIFILKIGPIVGVRPTQ